MAPVATFIGKLSALSSARPEASLKSLGSSSVNWPSSANSGLKVTSVTRLSPSPASGSNAGLSSPLPDFRRIASASLRGTGALKFSRMGRIGRQADWAFSRSQLKLAVNGSRTWKLKRFSTLLATPLGVLTPLP